MTGRLLPYRACCERRSDGRGVKDAALGVGWTVVVVGAGLALARGLLLTSYFELTPQAQVDAERGRLWNVGRDCDSRRTEPRGVVGFEVVLGALLAAVDGGVISSIHGGVEQRHGLF